MITETLILPSDPDSLDTLATFSETFSNRMKLDPDLSYRVHLTLSEAVTNAIFHGNKNHPEKNVTVKLAADDDQIIISVEDEGDGFRPKELPDPTRDSHLLKTGGRGVWLIQQYADNVTYQDKGRKVRIVFKRRS